jgi:hypothetical protein
LKNLLVKCCWNWHLNNKIWIFVKYKLIICFTFIFQEVLRLQQSILQQEQQLRSVSGPSYVAKNRDRALAEQSVSQLVIKEFIIIYYCFMQYSQTRFKQISPVVTNFVTKLALININLHFSGQYTQIFSVKTIFSQLVIGSLL